jgi:hypothetical protein
MLVIAAPLNYQILIDAIHLLPRLYPQVFRPHAAWREGPRFKRRRNLRRTGICCHSSTCSARESIRRSKKTLGVFALRTYN